MRRGCWSESGLSPGHRVAASAIQNGLFNGLNAVLLFQDQLTGSCREFSGVPVVTLMVPGLTGMTLFGWSQHCRKHVVAIQKLWELMMA